MSGDGNGLEGGGHEAHPVVNHTSYACPHGSAGVGAARVTLLVVVIMTRIGPWRFADAAPLKLLHAKAGAETGDSFKSMFQFGPGQLREDAPLGDVDQKTPDWRLALGILKDTLDTGEKFFCGTFGGFACGA